MYTKVANIYVVPQDWKDNSGYVYIGRAGYGERGEWGNPFVIDGSADLIESEQRVIVIRQYISWISNQLAEDAGLRDRIRALKGRYLVCFCAPKLCHGDILALLADTL
jgi:hypothetical protein